MKGNNHIHVVIRGVIGDVADLKPEGGVAVLLSSLVALLNDVRFQVQTDDVHGQVSDLCEIVVEDKGEVSFAAAEVDDAEGLVRGIVLILIVDDFQEPVDLAELVIPGADDLTFRGQDAHIHQRRNDHAFLQDVVFLPVGKCLGADQGRSLDRGGGSDVRLSLFGQEDFHDPAVIQPEVQLAVGFRGCFQAERKDIGCGNGFVENLGDRKGGDKELLSVSFRPDLPVLCSGGKRIAENDRLQCVGCKGAKRLVKTFVIHGKPPDHTNRLKRRETLWNNVIVPHPGMSVQQRNGVERISGT